MKYQAQACNLEVHICWGINWKSVVDTDLLGVNLEIGVRHRSCWGIVCKLMLGPGLLVHLSLTFARDL